MSLIKCPECGREISDLAENCPNCGFPVKPNNSSFPNTSSDNDPYGNMQQSSAQPIVVKPYEPKSKNSKLGIAALVLSILGCTFWLGIILAIIDLCKKDGNKKVCSIVAICVSVFWIILAVGVGGSEEDSTTQKANSTATTSTVSTQNTSESSQQEEEHETEEINEDNKEKKTQSAQMNKEDFIKSCIEIPYKTLARNPENYIGDHIVLTIKVSQIIQGGFFDDSQYYRVYTNDEYNMWLGDEYFMYDSRTDQDTKILQDDVLTVYAEFAGTQMVERALTGTKEEVLSIKAIYIDLISEEDLEDNTYNFNSESNTDSDSENNDGLTMGQRNALNSAKQYLSWSAFSYQGLINQLEYEKYSHEDAVYAADNCGADWNEQAVKSAKSYLEFSSFSKDGLIEQLEYEGFTHDQAVYGAEANGY